MKKIFTLVALALASVGMLATAQTNEITTLWGKTMSATYGTSRAGTSMGGDVAVGKDAVAFLGSIGTYSDSDVLKFGDTTIGKGTNYAGTSTSGNETVNLTLTDLDGNVKWSVYSTNGELMTNCDRVKIGNDGSVYAAFMMRHTEGRGTETPGFIDASGNETKLSDWNCISSTDNKEHRYYKVLVMKVSADGNIQWIREIVGDHTPVAGSSLLVNGIPTYLYGLAVTDDAIYVSGRATATTEFAKADGSKLTLTPHNVAGWSGDSQTTAGDMFVAKLDKDGYAENLLTTTGNVDYETSATVEQFGNRLYLMASVKGLASSTDYKLGSTTYSVPEYVSLLVAELDKDLGVKWSHLYKGSENAKKSKGILQYMRMNKIGDDLWLSGMGQYNLSNEDGTKTMAMTSTLNEGYILRLNANNGDWINATTAIKDFESAITGYMGVFGDEAKDEIWVYGYNFKNDGVFLRKYNKDLTTDKTQTKLLGGSLPTAYAAASSSDRLYTVARGRGSLAFAGKTETITADKYTAVYACYQLPYNVATVVENVAAKTANKVYGTQGELHVVAEQPAVVTVYNIMGAVVARLNAEVGDNAVSLPAGIYIAEGKKVVVR